MQNHSLECTAGLCCLMKQIERTNIDHLSRQSMSNNPPPSIDISKLEDREIVLTEIETSEYIRMSRSFLRHDRANGYRQGHIRGPEFIKIGRSVRYRKKDLDEWIVQNRTSRCMP